VLLLLLEELLNLFIGFIKWLDNGVIGVLLLLHCSLLDGVIHFFLVELFLKLTDHFKISVSDLLVIVFDLIVLLSNFLGQLSDGCVLSVSDLFGLEFSQILLLIPQHLHLILVRLMDFVADTLKIISQLRLLLHFVSVKSIGVFLLPYFLLFIGNFECAQVLFELSLIDPILILNVLDSDLRLLLQLGQLI